jgi:hypothetical protein
LMQIKGGAQRGSSIVRSVDWSAQVHRACHHGLQSSCKHLKHLVPVGASHRLAVWPGVLARLRDAALKIGDAQLQPAQFINLCNHAIKNALGLSACN